MKHKHYEQRTYRKTINRISTIMILDIIKNEIRCAHCGCTPHPVSFDFHHIEEKKYPVSFLANGGQMDMMLDEIQKCMPLCANCHRRLHYANNRVGIY